MIKPTMFSEPDTLKHIGTEIKFKDRLRRLEEVEEYFREKCIENRIEFSYDCTADENTFFKTLNYSTFAGLFIIHPLNLSQQLFQMFDAKSDNLPSKGHIEWIQDNIENNDASKYVSASGEEMPNSKVKDINAVLVMPGSNKCYDHVCSTKLKDIIDKHGSSLVIKPHPITAQEVLDDIGTVKKDAIIADRHDGLYSLLRQADIVYTTHISETALTSLLLGKRISPMEVFGNRMAGSFFHINRFCFSEPDPIPVLKSMFASPKSGVIHPDIDEDWKDKMDKYFDYILEVRNIQAGHYLR